MDAHHILNIIAGGFFELRILLAELPQKLFDADGERDQLRFFDDNGNGARVLVGVEIKDPLTGLSDGVGGDVVAGVNVEIDTGHNILF